MSAIQILSIDHVVVRVADLARSLRFYRDMLGCAEERRVDAIGLIQLRAGTSLIDLVPVTSPLGRAGGGPAPSFEAGGRNVDHFALALATFDEEKIRAHLTSYGVEPGEVSERFGAGGNGPSMYIRDPDDNTVELKGPPNEGPM